MKVLLLILISALLSNSSLAEIRAMTLNAEWLWTPLDSQIDGDKFNKGDMAEAAYLEEIKFYAELINNTGSLVIAISEIENGMVAGHIAGLLGEKWRAYFKQGRDTATGQDVAILSNFPLVKGSVTDFGFPFGTIDSSSKKKRLSKVLGAKFLIRRGASEFKLGVITSHFLSKRNNNPKKTANRQRQAVALSKAIQLFNRSSDALLVMGDFNDTTNSKTLTILRDSSKLKSVQIEGENSRNRIDHILYKGLIERVTVLKDLKQHSDHHAVFSVFLLEKNL